MAINTSALGVYDPTQFVGPTKKINRAMPQVNTNAALAPLTSSLGSYNINPQPTTGSGTAYGQVPGTIGIPASTWQQTMAQPGMQSQFNATQGLINNQLAGQLPQEVVNQIQDKAAQFGVQSGMPGSQFQGYQGLRNLGVDILGYQQQGATNAQNLAALVKSGQIDPSLAATIAAHNADLNAAPDPAKAAAQQMANWQQQLNAMKTMYPNYGSGTTINLGGDGTTKTNTPAPSEGTLTAKGTLPDNLNLRTNTPEGTTTTASNGKTYVSKSGKWVEVTPNTGGGGTGGTDGGGTKPPPTSGTTPPNATPQTQGRTWDATVGAFYDQNTGRYFDTAGNDITFEVSNGDYPSRRGQGQSQLPEDSTEWSDADWQSFFDQYAQEANADKTNLGNFAESTFGGNGTNWNPNLLGLPGGTIYTGSGTNQPDTSGFIDWSQWPETTVSNQPAATTSSDGIDWDAFNAALAEQNAQQNYAFDSSDWAIGGY